jgi:hypothetical protein
MLKSYEAAIEGDRVTWLNEKPNTQSARVLIVMIEESNGVEPLKTNLPKRRTPAHLIGQGKTLGDIVSPIVDEEDWECLK